MTDAIQIGMTIAAVVIGYALGVFHTRRAYRDALSRTRDNDR